MSEFITHCPECHQKILGETKYLGQRVVCPLCDQMFYLFFRFNPVYPVCPVSTPAHPEASHPVAVPPAANRVAS